MQTYHQQTDYQPSSDYRSEKQTQEERRGQVYSRRAASEPEGIGGWLIFPAIGLIFGIFRAISGVSEEPGFWSYGDLAAILFLNYLFFTKRNSFPTCYIIYAVLSVLGLFVLSATPATGGAPSVSTAYAMAAAAGAIIWIIYFLKSRRVANTFVN